MMKKIIYGGAILAVATTAVFAAGHAKTPEAKAVELRKAHMQLQGHNLGILGAMAQGKADYDADAASAAATNLAALASMAHNGYWLPGSDSASIEGTRALPEMWQNFADVGAKVGALKAAADAMSLVAGTDLASLQGAMGPVGGACGACHKAYRQSNN
jgi:cytochrome c556